MSFTSGLGSGLGSSTGEAIAPTLVAALGSSTPTTLDGRLAASQASQIAAKDSLSSTPTTGIIVGVCLGGIALFMGYLILNDRKERREKSN